jgi:hypothetical protein
VDELYSSLALIGKKKVNRSFPHVATLKSEAGNTLKLATRAML